MRTALKRIRGAIGMGITWAVAWAPIAVIVGTQIIDRDNSMDEMWVMIGTIPGFLSGVIFSIVLGIAARRQRLDDLTVPRVAAWGALAGVVIGVLPFVLGDSNGTPPAWLLAAVIIPTFTLLSTLSAAGTLAVARRALRRESKDVSTALRDIELTEEERTALLGEDNRGQLAGVTPTQEGIATPVNRGRM